MLCILWKLLSRWNILEYGLFSDYSQLIRLIMIINNHLMIVLCLFNRVLFFCFHLLYL